MSVKVKGKMYCQRCEREVLAQKNGHAVRNVSALGGAPFTGGLSLLAAKSEPWRCPICGSKCIPAWQAQSMAPSRAERIAAKKESKRRTKAATQEQWRCEKNGHLLDRKRTTCPIDGSPGAWRTL